MKGTCKNCIFWKPQTRFNNNLKDNKRGICEKIIVEEFEDVLKTEYLIFVNGGDYDCVYTGQDFGCIHFKEKQ